MNIPINYWAILGAVVGNMVVGSLWYSPILFGKQWMKMVDMNPDKKPEGGNKAMLWAVVWAFVAAYVMAHFVYLMQVTTLSGALQFAFWAWLGFVAPISAQSFIFHPGSKPRALFFLDNAHTIISFMVMAALLTLWK